MIKIHLSIWRYIRLFSIFIVILFLTACELIEQPTPIAVTPEPTPTLPPLALAVDVEDDAIVIPIPIEPPSFNAYLNDTGYEELIGELVFGALAEIGPDGNYYPELAADLPTLANGGLSEDGKTVTWHLRPNIYWSDNEPFTSADVRFTWEALRDSGIWAPGFDLIEDIETPDPFTAIVKYSEFYPNYLIQFGGIGTGVLPEHQCGATDQMLFWDCNFEPVSTGPYVLSQWIPGVRLTFTPNPNYFVPERPLASQIVFQIEPDPDRRYRSLIRGDSQLELWPEEPAISNIENSGTAIMYWTDPARFVLRLVFNLSAANQGDPSAPHPMLSKPRIREAIRAAVDVGRLNAEAFNNRGRPINTELSQLGCDIPQHQYNPGLANALLDEEGWVLVDPDDPVRRCRGCGTAPEGTPFVLDSYTYLEFGEQMNIAHQLIEEMMANVGIKINRQVVEGGHLWDVWANDGIELHGQFDMDLWDNGYYGVDPTIYMADMFDPRGIPSRNNPEAGLNVMRYRNPVLADIFDALYTPLPNNRRRALLCELAIVLEQDLPQIPLIAFPDAYGISIDLQGVAPHIYDTITWNAGDWQLVRPLDN